jgi:hypothetical protein
MMQRPCFADVQDAAVRPKHSIDPWRSRQASANPTQLPALAYGRQLHVVAGRIARDGQLGGHFTWLPEAVGLTGAMMQSALDDDGCAAHFQLEVTADRHRR